MNRLVEFLARAVMWRTVGRLMHRLPTPAVVLLGVAAAVAFVVAQR